MIRIFWIFLPLLFGASNLHAQTPFYQGKTITFVAGYIAGSYDDLWSRLIAQYLPKYIPGSPNMIVQNMPGAGSMIAANYISGVVKPDGLTLSGVQPALYFNQLVGLKEVKFDWPKFNFVGSPWQSQLLLYIRADSPSKTIQDARTATDPPKCGSTGPSSTGNYIPKLLNEILGTKFHVISGYQGGTDVDLAVEEESFNAVPLPSSPTSAGSLFSPGKKTDLSEISFKPVASEIQGCLKYRPFMN